MAGILELKRGTMDYLAKSHAVAQKLEYDSSAKAIGEAMESFAKKKMTIVVVGEARRGKSTLLNALLGQKEQVFPVDINVCTNIVTKLEYGEREKIVVTLDNMEQVEIKRSEIPDYVTENGNAGNYKGVAAVNAQLPLPLLKEGVVFVDTPGVGSLNISHAQTTYGFLPHADIVLFVTDTGAGFTETELSFLKKAYGYCKNIIFPLTKKDLNPNYKAVQEDNAAKIKECLGMDEQDIEIIPVASPLMLEYLEGKNPKKYKISNYEVLQTAIYSKIANTRAQTFIMPYLSEARSEVIKIATDVATQYQMLEENEEKTKELIEVHKDEVSRMKQLNKDRSFWNKKLNRIGNLGVDYSSKLATASSDARELLENAVAHLKSKICEQQNYNALYGEINAIFARTLLEIKDDIEMQTQQQITDLNSELGLDVDYSRQALELINFIPDSSLEVSFPARSMTDKLMEGGGRITRSAMGANGVAMVGMFAATLIGGPVAGALLWGAGALGIIGVAKGTKDAIKNHREADVPVVKNALSRHISDTSNQVNLALKKTMNELQQELSDDFTDKIDDRVCQIQESIERMKENIGLNKAETLAKQGVLKQKSDTISNFVKQGEVLELQVLAFTDKVKAANDQRSTHNGEEEQNCGNDHGDKEPEKEGGGYDFI